MTISQKLPISSFQFEYFQFGVGNNYLLAFNGFGENSSNLSILENVLSSQYTILAINLPFHGESKPNQAQELFTLTVLSNLISALQKKYNFSSFSLFGYSLGGKVALKILELSANHIEEVILFAPDGLKKNQWYHLAVGTKTMRYLFKSVMKRPGFLLLLANFLKKTKVIDSTLEAFVKLHLKSFENRMQLFHVWVCHRKIIPDLKKVEEAVKENNISIKLYFGKLDTVIPPKVGRELTKNLSPFCETHLLDSGHQLITEKNLKVLQKKAP